MLLLILFPSRGDWEAWLSGAELTYVTSYGLRARSEGFLLKAFLKPLVGVVKLASLGFRVP